MAAISTSTSASASLHSAQLMQSSSTSFPITSTTASLGDIELLHNESLTHEDAYYLGDIEQYELASKTVQSCLKLLYSLTATFALGGNIMTLIVLVLGRRSSRDLRFFLGNLALADISMAIFSIPFTYTNFILGRWIWGPGWCRIVHAMQHVSVFVSIWTLTAIGIERYLNVTFLFRRLMPKTPVLIILIWLLASGLGTFMWFSSKAEPFTFKNETYYDCVENWSDTRQEQIFTLSVFLSVFAIPLCILLFVYGSICYKLWHHSAPGNPNAIRDNAQSKAKIKSIKMLITICLLFGICWTPTHLFQLLRVFWRDAFDWLFAGKGERIVSSFYIATVITVHWMSMANSMCNPVIYCYMSDNFRADMKGIFRKYFTGRTCCRKRQPPIATASTLVIEQMNTAEPGRLGFNGNQLGAERGTSEWYPMGQPWRNGGPNGHSHCCRWDPPPTLDYRNGRPVKFKLKGQSSGTSSHSGGSSCCDRASGERSSSHHSKRTKQQYVFDRHKWSRRSNASRASSSSSGNLPAGSRATVNSSNAAVASIVPVTARRSDNPNSC